MAPMKRVMKTVKSRKSTDPIKSRCKLIKEAIEEAEEASAPVKDILCSTINVTIGAFKANRHPFNERFVTMIGEVLKAEQERLTKDVATKEAQFGELTPAKAIREEAHEQAKTDAAAKAEALDKAKQAVTEIGATLKEASAALKDAEKVQKSGDAELVAISVKKTMLEETQKDSLGPVLDGSAGDDKTKKVKGVLDVGKSFHFDQSLLSTAEPVLQKEVADRGSFDATCLEQLQAAFASAIAAIDEQLAVGAPGKAERAAAVQAAEAAKQAAEASQTDLKEKAQAAKEAKAAADAAVKAAHQSLDDFMPDLKEAGDSLDEAKEDIKDFIEGPMQSYNELKEVKEGDFKEEMEVPEVNTGKSYYEKINGMKLDRGIIDACRTGIQEAHPTTAGRVSLEDAKKVFAEVADGNKVTQCERWTVRYCFQEFKWTEEAHDWLIEELKKVPQEGVSGSPAKKARTSTGGSYYETIDGAKCDRAIIDACREAVAPDGRVTEDDAKKVWAKAADGNKVTDAERWTVRYCLSEFKWTRGAHDWILDELHKAA